MSVASRFLYSIPFQIGHRIDHAEVTAPTHWAHVSIVGGWSRAE